MKKKVPAYNGTLRDHTIMCPYCISECSGIRIFGKRIKSIAFSTDVAIIKNINADAIIAVYPFTPQAAISQSIISISDVPVFVGVGGGLTGGKRSVRLALQAEKHKIQVEVVGEHVECFGIRQILDEMIYNICENAIKYNKENGKVNIWVGNTLNGKKVIVQDTGIGIPKEHQDRIFERFYRVDKSHSRETGGTGLGLSIVKHGALLHNAEIHVESEEGKGTKMELIFHC